MKIILSRKGFDSENGRVPSPIFPNKNFLSLPIPVGTSHARFGEVSYPIGNLGNLVTQLTQGELNGNSPMHLDPDLRSDSMPRRVGWLPAFGQTGSAQRHLENQCIKRRDLFLFFGWFREVESPSIGILQYRQWLPDQHVIFGWLQVDEVVNVGQDYDRVLAEKPWLQDHPHLRGEYGESNTIYIASSRLCLPGLGHLPGGGIFPRVTERLVLTARGERKRSVWALPRCFLPGDDRPRLTFHTDRSLWQPQSEHVILRSVGRGQEFVLDCDEHPGVEAWVQTLFEGVLPEGA